MIHPFDGINVGLEEHYREVISIDNGYEHLDVLSALFCKKR